jgi:hypothetical protein
VESVYQNYAAHETGLKGFALQAPDRSAGGRQVVQEVVHRTVLQVVRARESFIHLACSSSLSPDGIQYSQISVPRKLR